MAFALYNAARLRSIHKDRTLKTLTHVVDGIPVPLSRTIRPLPDLEADQDQAFRPASRDHVGDQIGPHVVDDVRGQNRTVECRTAPSFRRLVRYLHPLGPRPVGELLLDLAVGDPQLLGRLERYRGLDRASAWAELAVGWRTARRTSTRGWRAAAPSLPPKLIVQREICQAEVVETPRQRHLAWAVPSAAPKEVLR